MNNLPALPILIPLATAILCLAATRTPALQRLLSLAGAVALVAATAALMLRVLDVGVLSIQAGAWPAPWGITLAADTFGAALTLVSAIVFLLCVIASNAGVDRRRQAYGFHPLIHTLMMGVGGAFVTGDLFNLYVWFEVMLMSSFVLVALGGERAQLEGAIKYVTLNLISSGMFLAGAGLLYGEVGTLNMADLSVKLADPSGAGTVAPAAGLFLVAFGLKAGVFPLFFWLPASYHTPPAVVSALFGGLLTKVGVFALARAFLLIFPDEVGFRVDILGAIAAVTMIVGLLGAIAQTNIRRMLSFALVGHIGYMVMGISVGGETAIAGMAFYAAQHMLVMTGLFLCAGLIALDRGSEDIRELGGLWRERPALAMVFLFLIAALAGVPPTPGFLGKLALIQGAVEHQRWTLLASLLTASVMTLYVVFRLWLEVFARPRSEQDEAEPETLPRPLPGSMWWAACASAALVAALAAGSAWTFPVAARVGAELIAPDAPGGYIDAVLGGAR